MKSPILRLSEALHEVAPTLRRTLGDAPVEEIASLLAETDGPTVMLFGTYNAGKSTLINALIGEDCAAVSSQPETSVVASYTWNGFTLLDTPGIDAPVEHEEISRDQLRRSDVVLFVLSADAPVEERAPYGEIARLLAGDKRVILILNTRGGHQETADAYQRLRERVLENLRAAGVTDAVPICLVNAKTMRRGREPGKSALLEHAGYPTLERELLDLLRGSSSFDRARARGRQLAALVEGGITQMEARPVSTEGRDLDQHAHQISAEQLRLEGDVELAIGREGNVLRADLHNAEDLDAVQDAWNRAAEALHERISQLIQGTSQRVGVEAASLEKRRMRGEAPVGGSPHDGTKSETGQADFMKSIGDVITMPSIKAAMNEELLSQGSSAVLHATKKYIPSLMKGIGPKTIEKISGKVAAGVGRGLGPAIQVLTSALEWRKARAAEHREAEEKEQRVQQLHDYLERSVKEFGSEMSRHYAPGITALFEPLDQQLAAGRSALSDREKGLTEDLAELRRAKQRIEFILREEGAQNKEAVPA